MVDQVQEQGGIPEPAHVVRDLTPNPVPQGIRYAAPILSPGHQKVFIHRRMDDKAFCVDEAGFTVKAARPSASPKPVKGWTCCTY